ncbi:MAG: hypothetical protein IH860_00265 [Chloroflexi bacterium]|nr:hypothetical protein [Chloroflexota bacterium]
MVRKSRRFAVRQAALARQKKKRGSLSQRQIELSTPAPQLSPSEEVDTNEETPPLPDPAGEGVLEAVPATPWRYAYVLSDIKRIGVLSSVILALLVGLSFFLG